MTSISKRIAQLLSALPLAGLALLLAWASVSPVGVAPELYSLQGETASSTPETYAASGDATLSLAERLDRLGAAAWQKAGDRGRGLKVLVLDSGFSGYRSYLGHALPEKVVAKSFRVDGNMEATASQHGILCGEVVHTLAPEAEILLANWEPDRPDQFLAAVLWARQQGVRIVTCSVITPSWSDGEGGGSVHRELARILGNGEHDGDVLFFASAGNTAQRHWCGQFTTTVHDAGARYHEWTSGCLDNPIKPWGGEVVSVELCCTAGGCCEITVYDATAQENVGMCVCVTKNDHGCAVVRFLPKDNHAYSTRVRQINASLGSFHLVVLGGGLQVTNQAASIPFPADGIETIAVGAVDSGGQRVAYSSCGPNSGSLKPDLVAEVPFPSCWRSRPFSGTSAAAPQAAGLAALLWGRHVDWSAKRVRQQLRDDAETLSAKFVPNNETGYGRIHLP